MLATILALTLSGLQPGDLILGLEGHQVRHCYEVMETDAEAGTVTHLSPYTGTVRTQGWYRTVDGLRVPRYIACPSDDRCYAPVVEGFDPPQLNRADCKH